MWSIFTCPVRKVSFRVYFKPDPESQVSVGIQRGQRSAASVNKKSKTVPENIQISFAETEFHEKLEHLLSLSGVRQHLLFLCFVGVSAGV